MPSRGRQTAVRLRSERVDSLDEPETPEAADRLEMIGLIVLPRQAYESEKGWVNRSGRDVYVLPSSRVREGSSGPYRAYVSGDVHEGDMIEIQGSTYQVEGEPAEFMRGARMAGVRITTAKIGRSR